MTIIIVPSSSFSSIFFTSRLFNFFQSFLLLLRIQPPLLHSFPFSSSSSGTWSFIVNPFLQAGYGTGHRWRHVKLTVAAVLPAWRLEGLGYTISYVVRWLSVCWISVEEGVCTDLVHRWLFSAPFSIDFLMIIFFLTTHIVHIRTYFFTSFTLYISFYTCTFDLPIDMACPYITQ